MIFVKDFFTKNINIILEGVLEYFTNIFTGSVTEWDNQLDDELQNRIKNLKENLLEVSNDEKKKYYGDVGEEIVIDKLKRCCMPMFIIHDLNICYNDMKIQNDLVVILKNAILIIECKNWAGSYTVDRQGNFIQTSKFNSELNEFVDSSHGVFSPVSQSLEHYNLIRTIIKEKLFLDEQDFQQRCLKALIHIVVIANEKCVVDLSNAPADIQDKVIKYDQINRYLEKFFSQNTFLFTKYEMMTIAKQLVNEDIDANLLTINIL